MTPPPYYPGNYGQQGPTMPPTYEAVASGAMKRVYVKMTLALIVTAVVALWGAGPTWMSLIAEHTWVMWLPMIGSFILVFAISGAINRMSSATASLLFYLFAVLMGLWIAPIFMVYTTASIAKTFFITAGTFGAMSVYGYFTSRDLTRWGSLLTMAVFGLLIAMVVNIFLKSSGLDWIISIAGVLIFVGLTAWDTQWIKRMAEQTPASRVGHLATIGALNLYTDFLNLFLFLLRFFGSSRD